LALPKLTSTSARTAVPVASPSTSLSNAAEKRSVRLVPAGIVIPIVAASPLLVTTNTSTTS
jgi:hypothetical protein